MMIFKRFGYSLPRITLSNWALVLLLIEYKVPEERLEGASTEDGYLGFFSISRSFDRINFFNTQCI